MNLASLKTEADRLDAADPLAHLRGEFHFPAKAEAIYLCGNSLGLQPRRTAQRIGLGLAKWRDEGVQGHFSSQDPWYTLHERPKPTLGSLVGASALEVGAMNNLSVNLHLMLAAFYQPKGTKRKIVVEKGAFPTDHYAVESHLHRWGHGADSLVDFGSPEGDIIDEEELVAYLEKHHSEIALVLWPAVQYYTGQYFDLAKIAQACQRLGIVFGVDAAHGVGNVPLRLHDWGVDWAVWCHYKYVNAGPGIIGGLFVHERHARRTDLPRLAGWWGHDASERFQMKPGFQPMAGVDGFQLSNVDMLSMTSLLASLELFEEAGIENLRQKSVALTGYLEKGLHQVVGASGTDLEFITPSQADRRGAQLSLRLPGQGKRLFDQLEAQGLVADYREPDVIRLAPAPLYNSFSDCYRCVALLAAAL